MAPIKAVCETFSVNRPEVYVVFSGEVMPRGETRGKVFPDWSAGSPETEETKHANVRTTNSEIDFFNDCTKYIMAKQRFSSPDRTAWFLDRNRTLFR